VRIPSDAIIPLEKLTKYLLVPKRKNDKSKFLAQAGFTLENPEALEAAIRQIIAENDAAYDRTDEFGDFYEVAGELIGVNGVNLGVVTIWIVRIENKDIYRFVTLKPQEKKK
jgi:hypothetical protein